MIIEQVHNRPYYNKKIIIKNNYVNEHVLKVVQREQVYEQRSYSEKIHVKGDNDLRKYACKVNKIKCIKKQVIDKIRNYTSISERVNILLLVL